MRTASPMLLCSFLLAAACSSGGAGIQKQDRWRPIQPPPGVCETPESNHPEGLRLVRRHAPNPKLPRDAPFKTGYACVLATIDLNGEVREVKLLSHSYRPFADEFVKVVRTWRFEPILVDGVPTEIRTVFTSSFEHGL